MEVMVRRNADYDAVARQAATTLELKDKDESAKLCLIIPRGCVDVGGHQKEWTLEHYLGSIGRKLKLGVGFKTEVCWGLVTKAYTHLL